MDNLKHEWLPVSKLVANDGRIAGLPSNPRQWNKQEFELLKNSIEETPQLLEARGLIVYPVGDVFVVLGGNMRLAAIKELGHTTAPCIVIPEGTDTDTLKAIVIKDNGSFGQWDYDLLANEWDTETLKEWGVPVFDTEGEDEESTEASVSEDDFDEGQDGILVRCNKGDVWKLGEHRLMCGDSIDLEQVKTLMGGGRS